MAAYDIDRLAANIRDLIRERGSERALLVGHDRGGAVAWWTAMVHPEVVERLAILNAANPRRLLLGLRRPRQLAKSWQMFVLQLPWLPERLARAGNWRAFRYGLERDGRPGAFSASDIATYIEAWEQPGAATATINYYRAAFRQSPRRAEARIRPIAAPTLVVWGERDRYLGPELAEPDPVDVPNLERVVRLPSASHWVQQDEPERVSQLLIEFFARAPTAESEPQR